jgi:metal-responsive CopG/Arc/MetJ family transcriptional regulator
LERIPKQIKFPAELVKKIEEYQEKNLISSFSAAVYELIRKGLNKESE